MHAAPTTSVRPARRLFAAAALLLPLAFAPAAHAFDISFGGGSKAQIKGSGKMVDQARTPGTFTRIRVESSMNVVARPGSSAKLMVHADDNILPVLETVLEGDTLVIRYKEGTSIRMHSDPVVTVDFTQLSAVDLRGSGNLNIESIKADTLQLNLAGSGDVKLRNADLNKLATNLAGSGDVSMQGRAVDVDISIAGSGDVHAKGLQAANVKVSIAGSGNAEVNATATLNAQIAGSGDVSYLGNPKVKSSVMGSGSVSGG